MISFIVPAYNEERWLGPTLRALHTAGHILDEPYEIVVADDDSADGTAALAGEHGARVARVSHRQIAATRNSGARHARGQYYIFVDADTLVNPEVVRAAVTAMRQGAAGGGCWVRFDGRVPLYARLLIPSALTLFRWCRFASGCFLYARRDAFEAAGGFDETLFGSEELAMSRALKKQGRFVILRECVLTSGRKLRSYSGWHLLKVLVRLLMKGPRSVKSRRGMELWYEDGREDPELDRGKAARTP